MNINFNFSDKVWWRPSYYPYTNTELLMLIDNNRQKLVNLSSSILAEQRLYFLRNCLIEEHNVPKEQCSIEHIESILINKDSSNTSSLKIKNMYDTVETVFKSKLNIEDINVELAKKIHKIIGGCGLIKDCGEFRSNNAKPYGEQFLYECPEKIESRMIKLFEATLKATNQNFNRVDNMIKIAAIFLSSFLTIHPFSNGNGRVARILTSLLLIPITTIPVLLNGRETYLQCLREAQTSNGLVIEPLATFILENIFTTIDFFINICL